MKRVIALVFVVAVVVSAVFAPVAGAAPGNGGGKGPDNGKARCTAGSLASPGLPLQVPTFRVSSGRLTGSSWTLGTLSAFGAPPARLEGQRASDSRPESSRTSIPHGRRAPGPLETGRAL